MSEREDVCNHGPIGYRPCRACWDRRQRAKGGMTTPCPKCGLPMNYDDPEEVPIRHASNGECVKALRAENARLREELTQRREHMRRGITPGRSTGGDG